MRMIVISPINPFKEKTEGISYVVEKLLDLYPNQKCIALLDTPNESIDNPHLIPILHKKKSKIILLLKWLFSFYPMCVIRYQHHFKAIKQAIEKLQFDKVHICFPFLMPLIGHFPRNKVLFYSGDSFSLVILRRLKQEKSWIKKSYLFLDFLKCLHMERKFLQKASEVFFVSDVDIAHEKKWGCLGNFHFVPLGVNESFFHPKMIQEKDEVIVFVGNFSYFTNVQAADFLIDKVMPLLIKKNPFVKLKLVGIHPTKKMLESQNNWIEVTGYVEDIKPFLDQAKIFVCPLMVGGGVKIKVLQALAMEKIVIGSEVAFEGIDGKHLTHYFCIKGFDPKNWSDTIDEVLKSDHLDAMAFEGKKLIQNGHSWNAFLQTYRNKIENLNSV